MKHWLRLLCGLREAWDAGWSAFWSRKRDWEETRTELSCRGHTKFGGPPRVGPLPSAAFGNRESTDWTVPESVRRPDLKGSEAAAQVQGEHPLQTPFLQTLQTLMERLETNVREHPDGPLAPTISIEHGLTTEVDPEHSDWVKHRPTGQHTAKIQWWD